MDIMDYYRNHSELTDPGELKYFYHSMPNTIEEILTCVQAAVLNPVDVKMLDLTISKEKMQELNFLSVRDIIHGLLSLGSQPLVSERPPHHRIFANCRNISLLLCSVLREKKIPARLRIGFSHYMMPFFKHDKVVIEYWNENSQEWQVIDVVLNELNIETRKVPFGPINIPKGQYIYAGSAWKLCCASKEQAKKFGSGIPGLIKFSKGMWYVRNIVLRDLAMLNKKEYRFNDWWGYMYDYIEDDDSLSKDREQVFIINNISDNIDGSDINLENIQDYINNCSASGISKIFPPQQTSSLR